MKNGKNPNVRQKKLLKDLGLNYSNWLITKNTPEAMEILHRVSGKTRVIPRELF